MRAMVNWMIAAGDLRLRYSKLRNLCGLLIVVGRAERRARKRTGGGLVVKS